MVFAIQPSNQLQQRDDGSAMEVIKLSETIHVHESLILDNGISQTTPMNIVYVGGGEGCGGW